MINFLHILDYYASLNFFKEKLLRFCVYAPKKYKTVPTACNNYSIKQNVEKNENKLKRKKSNPISNHKTYDV